jgi:aminoglycoside phosphotransferase (APT) family kinase protein
MNTNTSNLNHRELDLAAVSRYLDPLVHGGLNGSLQAELISGGRSNPTYLLADETHRWVLRRPPFGLVLPTAHDMARECRVQRALRSSTVPVPHIVGFCEDPGVLGAPFYVMDRIDGTTLRGRQQTAVLTPGQRAELGRQVVETMASLHDVDPAAVGLGDWGRPDGFLERQLRRWVQQWEGAHTVDRPAVTEVVSRLGRSLPETRSTGIVHGDYKIDNLMLDPSDPTRVVAVLDWEMSTLGDTLCDLGTLMSFWDEIGKPFNPITQGVTAHDGFPTRDEVAHLYAERRRVDIDSLDWYVAFADLKVAVILEGIHTRYLQQQTAGEGFDEVGPMIEPLLERALERTSGLGR